MSKIKRVITPQYAAIYQIGDMYNGLIVHNIEDHSQEFSDGWNNLIIGFTKNRETVFEIINTSTIIEYMKEET